MGQQGPPTDAAASTPDGARRRPWALPIDYRDNRRTTQRWGQYWAPIGGQFCAPVDSVDGKDRKAANFVLLPKGGGSRSDAEAAPKPLLNKQWH